MPNQIPFCKAVILKMTHYFIKYIYVKVTIPICLVGIILNLLNVLVFTRKTMHSPPNLILTHLAFVDFLALLTRIAIFWLDLIRLESVINNVDTRESYAFTLVCWYTEILLTKLEFISAFLTVQLAAWRYIAVVHPLKERHWCTKKITRYVVIIGYVICCVAFAVYHLSFDIDTINIDGKTKYKLTPERHPIMYSIHCIFYGLVAEVLPSLVLAGLTSRIVITLLARKARREQLTSSAGTRSNIQNAEMRQQTNTSTTILLAVAALYFIAEFPNGILWLLTTINEDYWYACYISLLSIQITERNINMSITFMVYYTLSQQFRTTFKSLFSRNPRTSIDHRTRAPFALGDPKDTAQKTVSGWKTTEV